MKRTRQSERLSKKARQEEEKEVEKEEEEGIQVGVDKEEIETKESEEIENQEEDVKKMQPQQLIVHIRNILGKIGNPVVAAGQKQYMRNQFEFFGISTPIRRKTQKEILKKLDQPNEEEAIEFVRLCWIQEEREFQHLGMEYCKEFAHKIKPETLLTLSQEMITQKSWWDTVDFISPHIVGKWCQDNPNFVKNVYQWIDHENFWMRRAAILHQLNLKEQTNKQILFEFCLKRSFEEEFFIRKSIGWALRQYARINPKEVREFVKSNQTKLSKLSVQQALKHL